MSAQFPHLDLTKDPRVLQPGTNERTLMCRRLQESLETYGCAVVRHDCISDDLRNEVFSTLASVFHLPLETKRRSEPNQSQSGVGGPYFGYVEYGPYTPRYESFAVPNGTVAEDFRTFVERLWPAGNDSFYNTLHPMSVKLLAVMDVVMKMVLEIYGGDDGSFLERRDHVFRMSKYKAPTSKDEDSLTEHTDPNWLTVLTHNGTEGFVIKNREGEWMDVNSDSGFVFVVGQSLRAWTNGKVFSPPHKIVMKPGDNDRISCIIFNLPKGDHIVKPSSELIDEEHPPLYKPYKFKDFLDHRRKIFGFTDGAVDIYARIDPKTGEK